MVPSPKLAHLSLYSVSCSCRSMLLQLPCPSCTHLEELVRGRRGWVSVDNTPTTATTHCRGHSTYVVTAGVYQCSPMERGVCVCVQLIQQAVGSDTDLIQALLHLSQSPDSVRFHYDSCRLMWVFICIWCVVFRGAIRMLVL